MEGRKIKVRLKVSVGMCSGENIILCASIEKEKFYSARLYKAVVGLQVTAVFCVCPELSIYTKV